MNIEPLESRQMLSATPELLPGPDLFPSNFTPVGSSVFFTDLQGDELWVTDGTQAGTMFVADIDGGSSVRPLHFTAFKDRLVFGADDGTGLEPWISDGTLAGTMKIKDINPSGSSLYYYNGLGIPKFGAPFYFHEGQLFFAAEDEYYGQELWKTDGTEEGTVRVADIKVGSGGSYPGGLYGFGLESLLTDGEIVESGGMLFFGAHTDAAGFELWKSDGTESGTMLVKDIRPGSGSPYISPIVKYHDILQLTDFDDTLFFVTADSDYDFELWKSDGTEAGTVRVKDIRPGTDDSYPMHLTVVDNSLLFFAKDDQNFDLWKSDGTEAGTVLVKDFTAGNFDNHPNVKEVVASDGSLFFVMDDGIHGRELWKSDGTEAGTVMVADIQPGSLGSEPYNLVAVDGGVVFRADDGSHGNELWASDGTAAGTYLVVEFVAGSSSSYPRGMVYNDGKLYFSAASAYDAIPFTTQSAWVLDISLAPVPDAGGPYSGPEGDSIVLSAASSTGNIFSYEWDFDNDGQYDDAVGENVNFNATENGVYTIGLRINGAGGPTDTTTVTVNNVAPAASISGTTAIYRGEEVTFTLAASDASPVDQAGLFNFEIDWDGNGTVDETLLAVPSGTTVQHAFPDLSAATNIQVRATDKDASTGSFSQLPVTVTPHVLRDDGFGNTDLIYGGTPGFDAVFVLGQAPGMSVYFQVENAIATNRLEFFGSAITGRVILHGYGFSDILAGELGPGNVMEIYGGDGDDIIVGGSLGDFLYGGNGDDIIIGGTRATDGDDYISGGEGRDSLYGYLGADTLDGGAGEDLLVSDQFLFTKQHSAIQSIHEEWKSARPYSERISNILGITSTGVNGPYNLQSGVTLVDDGAEDTLIGGLGELDWFFFDFDQDLLGDTIEVDEEETDSDP